MTRKPKPAPPEPDDPLYRRRCNRCDRERGWTVPACECGCPEFRVAKEVVE